MSSVMKVYVTCFIRWLLFVPLVPALVEAQQWQFFRKDVPRKLNSDQLWTMDLRGLEVAYSLADVFLECSTCCGNSQATQDEETSTGGATYAVSNCAIGF